MEVDGETSVSDALAIQRALNEDMDVAEAGASGEGDAATGKTRKQPERKRKCTYKEDPASGDEGGTDEDDTDDD